MILDREQLDALRRQIEEDYKLDLAAIERLQRRFIVSGSNHSSGSNVTTIETQAVSMPKSSSAPAESQPDELTGSLRAMFSNYRK